ncbi:hypothetical protein M5K25_005813 [Dendrobium thyrsiflorum]|uniref:Uncharacterized protein n=1 Tax=Dendrobium thyrsiflorum TaxID=117978 RepID=A0ABD0VR42_DENTH
MNCNLVRLLLLLVFSSSLMLCILAAATITPTRLRRRTSLPSGNRHPFFSLTILISREVMWTYLYVSLDEVTQADLFYYFVELERKPSEDPLILWLTGGPGCTSFYALAREIADGGGMDDGPDQDPMVPSSRSTQPDRRILVSSHGLLRPRVPCRTGMDDLMPLGSIRALTITIIWLCHLAANHLVQRAPSHNRLSCGAIWRQNRRLEDTYHILTGKRMFENESYEGAKVTFTEASSRCCLRPKCRPIRFKVAPYNGTLPMLVYNPYAWTKISNVIFLDWPAMTGFSFLRNDESYITNDIKSSKEIYNFLKQWLLDHPHFLSNPFYVGGNSYGGKMVPIVAHKVAEGQVDIHKSPLFDLNLEIDQTVEEYIERIVFTLAATIDEQLPSVQWQIGYICNNPVTSTILDRMVGEWMMDPIKIPWFRHPGSSWSLVCLVRGGSRPNLTEGSLSAAMGCFVQGYLVDLGWMFRAPSHNRLSCGAIWRQNRQLEDSYHVLTGKRMLFREAAQEKTTKGLGLVLVLNRSKIFRGFMNELMMDNFLTKKCQEESKRPALMNAAEADRSILSKNQQIFAHLLFLISNAQLTYASYLAYHWANDNDTRAALHVKEGTVKEWQICRDDFPYEDTLINSSIPYHHDLIARGYRALVFSGDHDLTVPFLGTMEWIGSLNLSVMEPWRSWHVNGQVGGYTVRYSNNLTYATVKGGGHEPAKDRKMETSALFNRWISHKSL